MTKIDHKKVNFQTKINVVKTYTSVFSNSGALKKCIHVHIIYVKNQKNKISKSKLQTFSYTSGYEIDHVAFVLLHFFHNYASYSQNLISQ